MDIYIQKFGSSLKKEKEHFLISSSEENQPLSVDIVDCFIISDGCSITTDSLKLAIENNIPLYFSDNVGRIYGKIWNTSYNTSAELHLKQLKIFSSKYGNLIGRKWIIEKIETQKKHLMKLHMRKKLSFFEIEKQFNEIIEKIRKINLEIENYSNIIMGYEGNASRIYYSHINNFLSDTWKFEKRNHQGAKEPYNIILNYLFGVLYSKIDHILTINGLNLNIGILHSNLINQKSLLFDFIEPYRYIVWEVTFGLFSKKLINKSFFNLEDNKLTYEGKKIILTEFYKKLNQTRELNNKNYKLEHLISKKVKNLVKDLMENEVYNKL
ncbi:MAG: CRISPR-associated endonuclease Cas1 [Fusobacterium ulcerans]|uniref:CRISPR-associated endonuclease Cas1 n=1 Tax=Fusobacterium ulcerans TaxID=861 RepID=UPI003A86D83F